MINLYESINELNHEFRVQLYLQRTSYNNIKKDFKKIFSGCGKPIMSDQSEHGCDERKKNHKIKKSKKKSKENHTKCGQCPPTPSPPQGRIQNFRNSI